MITRRCITKSYRPCTLLFSRHNHIFSPENKKRTIAALKNHQSISRFENFLGEQFEKTAAVLCPLCYDLDHRPSILYNVRSKALKRHRGQISFPGGSVDSKDSGDMISTALRETEEELGLDRSRVEIWTDLPYVPTITSLMRVSPILAMIKDPIDPKQLTINSDEVDVAFTVPIQHLCDPVNWGTSKFTKGCQVFFSPQFRNLHEFIQTDNRIVIWGLTALVTHVVLSALTPDTYRRRIRFSKENSSANLDTSTSS